MPIRSSATDCSMSAGLVVWGARSPFSLLAHVRLCAMLMVGEPVPRDWGLALSLGPKPRFISAWASPGIVPGIVSQPNLSRAPTARFIAFDEYLLGGATSCSENLARAFSPHLPRP